MHLRVALLALLASAALADKAPILDNSIDDLDVSRLPVEHRGGDDFGIELPLDETVAPPAPEKKQPKKSNSPKGIIPPPPPPPNVYIKQANGEVVRATANGLQRPSRPVNHRRPVGPKRKPAGRPAFKKPTNHSQRYRKPQPLHKQRPRVQQHKHHQRPNFKLPARPALNKPFASLFKRPNGPVPKPKAPKHLQAKAPKAINVQAKVVTKGAPVKEEEEKKEKEEEKKEEEIKEKIAEEKKEENEKKETEKKEKKVEEKKESDQVRRDGHHHEPLHKPVYTPPRPSYNAPAPSYAAPQREIIIKQAGPSQTYGWVGHGRYAPYNIPNPFQGLNTKWIPMGNNVFEVGLLYPPAPASSNSYSAPAAPSYSAPAPAASKPAPPPPPPATSYSAPAPAPAPISYSVPAAAPSTTSYSSPAAPAPAPASTSYSSAPAPASTSYSSAPAPAPASTSYSSAPAPAPASTSYSSAPAPAPASFSYSSAPAPSPASPSYSTSSVSTSYSSVASSAPSPASTSYGSFAPAPSPAPASTSYNSVAQQPAQAPSTYNTFSSAPAAPASTSYNSVVQQSAPAPSSYNSNNFAPAPAAPAPAPSSYNNVAQPAPAPSIYNSNPFISSAPAPQVQDTIFYNNVAPAAPVHRPAPAPVSAPSGYSGQSSTNTFESVPAVPSSSSDDTPVYNAGNGNQGSYDKRPVTVYDPETGSFVSKDARIDLATSNDSPQIDVFDVPIKVEETFEGTLYSGAPVREREADFFQTDEPEIVSLDPEAPVSQADLIRDAIFRENLPQSTIDFGAEPEVFYIFYENEDDAAPVEVYAGAPPVEEEEETQATSSSINTPSAAVAPAPVRAVPPPGHSLFSPPSQDEIRTIYVPLDQAVNVPKQYTLDIGTSFGYKGKKQQEEPQRQPQRKVPFTAFRTNPGSVDELGFPNFPSALSTQATPSYDNPISSYDAPLTNDESYTAKAATEKPGYTDTKFFGKGGAGRVRKVRKTAAKAATVAAVNAAIKDVEDATLFYPAPNQAGAAYGTRLTARKPYSIQSEE